MQNVIRINTRQKHSEVTQCNWLHDNGMYCAHKQYYRHYCKEHALVMYDWIGTYRQSKHHAYPDQAKVKEMYDATIAKRADAVQKYDEAQQRAKRFDARTKPSRSSGASKPVPKINYRTQRGTASAHKRGK